MNKVKGFLNETNVLLQYAVAIAICQSRPTHLPLKEYVYDLQEKARVKFGCFEQSQLSQEENLTFCEQEWVMSQLSDFLSVCTSDSPITKSQINNGQNDMAQILSDSLNKENSINNGDNENGVVTDNNSNGNCLVEDDIQEDQEFLFNPSDTNHFEENSEVAIEHISCNKTVTSDIMKQNETVHSVKMTSSLSSEQMKSSSQYESHKNINDFISSTQSEIFNPMQEIVSNSSFVIAVIQLKNIIKSQPSMPAKDVHNIVSLAMKSDSTGKINKVNNAIINSNNECSIDFSKKKLHYNGNVSSSSVHFLMRSLNVNSLMLKSLGTVLNHLSTVISSATIDILEDVLINWKSTTIGQTLQMVSDVMDTVYAENHGYSECTDLCLKFITQILATIWQGNNSYENLFWEYICEILLPLAKKEHICPRAITCLLEELLGVFTCTEKLHKSDSYTFPYKMTRIAERSFYYFNFVKNLLIHYESIHKSIVSKKFKKVSDMEERVIFEQSWKKAFTSLPPISEEVALSEKSFELILQWEDILEKCFNVCENQPFQKLFVQEMKLTLANFDKIEKGV